MNNYILYHYPLCPFSRKVRFLLNEMKFSYKLKTIKFWKKNIDFLKLNPAHETPVLIDEKKQIVLVDSFIISDYLYDIYKNNDELLKIQYFSNDIYENNEIKRLEMWFDKKFYNEVSKYILEEKVFNSFIDKKSQINTKRLKCGQNNLDGHLRYIEFLLEKRKWLAGETFTIADITASTQLSSIDYLGEINWNKYKKAKDWYLTIKSKTAFHDILKDKIEGFTPSKNYAEFDFD